MAVITRHHRLVQVTRIAKHGTGLCVVLNRGVRDIAPWNVGDAVAVRQCGDMLLLDRIDLNEYAKLRTGIPQERPASAGGNE